MLQEASALNTIVDQLRNRFAAELQRYHSLPGTDSLQNVALEEYHDELRDQRNRVDSLRDEMGEILTKLKLLQRDTDTFEAGQSDVESDFCIDNERTYRLNEDLVSFRLCASLCCLDRAFFRSMLVAEQATQKVNISSVQFSLQSKSTLDICISDRSCKNSVF